MLAKRRPRRRLRTPAAASIPEILSSLPPGVREYAVVVGLGLYGLWMVLSLLGFSPSRILFTALFDISYWILIYLVADLYTCPLATTEAWARRKRKPRLHFVTKRGSLGSLVHLGKDLEEVDPPHKSGNLTLDSRSSLVHVDTSAFLSHQHVFDLVECIVLLVLIDGGGVVFPREQMKLIRSAAYTFPSTHSLCPQLIAFLQILAQNTQRLGDAGTEFSAWNRLRDGCDEVDCIARGFATVLAVLKVPTADAAVERVVRDGTVFLWVRQHLASVFAWVLGARLREAYVEVQELLVEMRRVSFDGKQRNSVMTLVQQDEEENGYEEVVDRFLFYARGEGEVQVGWRRGERDVRVGTVRMESVGLKRGDLVVLLVGWSGDGGVVPKSNFVLEGNTEDNEDTSVASVAEFPSGFSKCFLARLERVDELYRGETRLTMTVLRQRENVAFEFGGVSGVDVDQVVFQNRVRDGFVYGAVRVNAAVVDAFFGDGVNE